MFKHIGTEAFAMTVTLWTQYYRESKVWKTHALPIPYHTPYPNPSAALHVVLHDPRGTIMVLRQGTFSVQHQNDSYQPCVYRTNLKNYSPFPILLFYSPSKQSHSCFPFPFLPTPSLSSPVISSSKMSLKSVLLSTVLAPVQTFISSSRENYNCLLTGVPISGYCPTSHLKP